MPRHRHVPASVVAALQGRLGWQSCPVVSEAVHVASFWPNRSSVLLTSLHNWLTTGCWTASFSTCWVLTVLALCTFHCSAASPRFCGL